MENRIAVSRVQLIYALCLPLAVLMGYLLADPTDLGSIGVVLAVVGVLCIPILMRYYHPLLILTWNAAVNPILLPGRPYLWMLLAFLGLIFAVANRFTTPDAKFVILPSINKALLAIAAVTIFTAWIQGGFGIRALGAARYGGKGYFYILAAVAGYFTLVSQRIPVSKATLLVSLFFLSGITALVPNIAYLGGSKLEFLYYLFPTDYALEQAMADFNINEQFGRIYGLTYSSMGLYCFLLARYGLRGVFDLTQPWRLGLFILAAVGCLFCGYRSFLVLLLFTVVAQLYFERLLRWRIVLTAAAGLTIALALLIPNAARLPNVVQRTLSVLPIEISPAVRQNTEGSSMWRTEMWKQLVPTIPRYLFVGKGLSVDPTELRFALENAQRGYIRSHEPAILTGDYHNGPLSILIPFGIWGILAFGWLVVVGLRYLYRNYKEGNPELHGLNTFLLALFVARLAFFCTVFGGFYGDLAAFAGILGVSASLNGSEAFEPATEEAEDEQVAMEKELTSDRLPV